MNHFLSCFSPALKFLIKDKVNFLLALVPVLIGLALYIFLGQWAYQEITTLTKDWIGQYVSNGMMGTFVYYIIIAVFTLFLFLLINWGFVLVVSLLAVPFNDVLSKRVARAYLGANYQDEKERGIFKTIWNEIKKIVLIIILTVIALGFSYIPFFAPISFLISSILFSVNFLDFSWSRHGYSFGKCMAFVGGNWGVMMLGGALFLFLTSIPLLNLLVLPYAISFYTVLWCKIQNPNR